MFGDRWFNVASDNTALSYIKNSKKSRVYKYEFEYRGEQSFIDLFSMNYVTNKTILKERKYHQEYLANQFINCGKFALKVLL